MHLSNLLQRIQIDLLLHGAQYKFYIELAAVAVLVYLAWTDFMTFKIRNSAILLLLVLYVLLAFVSRSWSEILLNVLFAAIIFGVMLWFFAQRIVGGGDVKLLAVACLWVGTHCALLFSGLLLVFVVLHLAAARLGWAQTKPLRRRNAIPYAPSVAAALIGLILLRCV